jgi:murein DD-endopeptidase MepM/ murein hydrolase activator NlpD
MIEPIEVNMDNLKNTLTKGVNNGTEVKEMVEIPKENIAALLRASKAFPRAFKKTASSSSNIAEGFDNTYDPTTDMPDIKGGYVTQGYGVPVDYEAGGKHRGIDIGAPLGTPIPEKRGGTVIAVQRSNSGYGNSIMVKGDDGKIRHYSHLNKINVNQGDQIAAGFIIGEVGSTGYSTGSHLDYEILK